MTFATGLILVAKPQAMKPHISSAPTKAGRDAGLDLARAWAVTVMVLGHSLAATLRPADLEIPLVATYWQMRGLTAPLFLIVSGWAVSLLFCRRPRPGLGHVRERGPRILTLIGLGLLLRLPTWGLGALLRGDAAVWQHFLAMDVLQLIGTCLLAGSLLFSLSRRPGVRALLAVLLAVATAVSAPAVWRAAAGWGPWAQLVLGAGEAPFPLWPWAAYFFAGMGVGALSSLCLTSPRLSRFDLSRLGHTGWPRAAVLVAAGAGLTAVASAVGVDWSAADAVASPWLTCERLGKVMLTVGVLNLAPAGWGARLAFLGRRTLSIYVIHMILVYGGLGVPGLYLLLGPVLPLWQSLGLSLATICVSVGLAHLWSRLQGRAGPWIHSRLKNPRVRAIVDARK